MSERLALPDGYKKGGRVKKGKKSKRAKKAKTATPKKYPRRTARMVPVATGPMPTTGMGSVVFGAPQNPSYFRAVGPQQEFANMPDVLKGLKEGQQNIMRELERRKAQEAADRMFASQVEEEEGRTPRRMKKVTPMSVSSTRGTPLANYDFSFASPLKILLPNTLNPLERQGTRTPDMMTPMGAAFQAPSRAVPLSYEGPLSSKEAMAQPYRGADESLPPQEVASGEQMVPQTNTIEPSSSAFVPLQASMPESQSDSLGRSTSAPMRSGYKIPGTNQLVIRRPIVARVAPAPAPAPVAPAPAPAPARLAPVKRPLTSIKQLKAALAARQANKD